VVAPPPRLIVFSANAPNPKPGTQVVVFADDSPLAKSWSCWS
jgi:hypothetical protein